MKKLISLLLALLLVFGSMAFLYSCGRNDTGNDDGGGTVNPPETPETPPSEEGPEPEKPTIVVPPLKDYERGTVDFDKLVYARPDMQTIKDDFDKVIEAIQKNEISPEEQVNLIIGLEEGYTNLLTMYSLVEIYSSKDASSAFFAEEKEYISTNYPDFSKKVEDMFVAAAKSPNKEYFEENYFLASLDEYVDGGIYTDELVALLADEAALEAQYSSLSTATVEVTYKGKLDTVDNHLESVKNVYGEDSNEYLAAVSSLPELFYAECARLARPIYVELIKVRRLIADELEYDSYAQVAYEELGHEYTPDEMKAFIADIRNYVFPVYNQLWVTVFDSYFRENQIGTSDRVTLINDLYELYGKMDEDLAEVYSYMLQHKLYDVESESPNRQTGAFTTYIEGNNSPFIFMSAKGYTSDYMTLSHEFGHFVDNYVNYGESASLDLAEVSSQGLEWLTLLKLSEVLPEDECKYLSYDQLSIAMEILLNQGIIAAFEHYAYEIPYENISEAALEEAMDKAWDAITGAGDYQGSYSAVIMVHTVEYPFYVQSYCTSLTATLEIFFAENDKEGDGLEMYKTLIIRDDPTLSYQEILTRAGLSSPFEKDLLKRLADEIHYFVRGTHYYDIQEDDSDLAA